MRRVIEPLLSGARRVEPFPADDIMYVRYVRDLGPVRIEAPMAIANPIYRDVIQRVYRRDESVGGAPMPAWEARASFRNPAG